MKVSQDFCRSFGWSIKGDDEETASLLNWKKFLFSIPVINLFAALGETGSYGLSTGEKWRIGLAYTIVPLLLIDLGATATIQVKHAIDWQKTHRKEA